MRQLVTARLWRWCGCAALLALLLGCAHSRARTWHATVTHVSDGDTLYVRGAGDAQAVAVRVHGIDAPEICQTGGTQSREALARSVLQQRVTVVGLGHDAYGRQLAHIYLEGRDIARDMVRQGQAWSYRVGKKPGPYDQEQREARAARRGLFAQDRPERPAAFRQRHGSCHTTH